MLTLFMMAAALEATSHTDEHSSQFEKCAKTCADCQLACDACFHHCQSLAGKGKEQHTQTARYCVDCAECCKACASLCSRQSPLAAHMLDCCAKCCDDCAKSCETMPDDKHMAGCAKTCRECAKQCRNAAKARD